MWRGVELFEETKEDGCHEAPEEGTQLRFCGILGIALSPVAENALSTLAATLPVGVRAFLFPISPVRKIY